MAVSVPTRKYIEARFVNIKSRIVNIELSVTKYIYINVIYYITLEVDQRSDKVIIKQNCTKQRNEQYNDKK